MLSFRCVTSLEIVQDNLSDWRRIPVGFAPVTFGMWYFFGRARRCAGYAPLTVRGEALEGKFGDRGGLY